LNWFTQWFIQLMKNLLVNEGHPVIRILVTLVASFLIYACYILLSELMRRLKDRYPKALNSSAAKTFEFIVQWSTIIWISILLLTGIVVVFKELIEEIWPPSDKTNGSQIGFSEAVKMNLNHLKYVAQYVLCSVFLMVALTGLESLYILLHSVFHSFYDATSVDKPSLSENSTKDSQKGVRLTLMELVDALAVRFPQEVQYHIDLHNQKMWIDQIELKNTSEKAIPAGEFIKLYLLRGIDYRVRLVDKDVLPAIMPGASILVGPFESEIPVDIIASHQDWNLAFYILDSMGNEALLFRSGSVSFV
jgi:hypothetical protein